MQATPDQFLPHPTAESAFFWEGLGRGELMLPYCATGGHYFFPPMPGCPVCGAPEEAIEHRVAAGTGILYAWTVAHYAFDSEFEEDIPYTIVTVEVAEGPRVYGRWVGPSDQALAPGMAVKFVPVDRRGTMIVGFTSADAGA